MLAYWSGLQDRPEPAEARELVSSFSLNAVPSRPVTVQEGDLERCMAICSSYFFY